jgi:hypothetical protein
LFSALSGPFGPTLGAANTAGGSPPVITSPSSLVTGTVGTIYPTTTFTATGTAPITWAVQSGTLPTGMTFSSGGVLSGTPTATASGSITFRATNAFGFADRPLTLTVNAAGGGTLSGIEVQVAPVISGVQGSFVTLSSFTQLSSWVDGGYTQDFWRAGNTIDDMTFVVTRERGTDRVEVWMYRPPATAYRSTFSGWGYGPDLSAQINADSTYDVRVSVNSALITPVYSASTTTRVLCATGTCRRLASAFKPWVWTNVDSAVAAWRIAPYNGLKAEMITTPLSASANGISPSYPFSHATLGGASSSGWYDGVRNGAGGSYISSRAVNHAWEAAAVSDRRNSIASNLTQLELILRQAAEYSGTMPQYFYLNPTTLKPYDPQKGANIWTSMPGGPNSPDSNECRIQTTFVPGRAGYEWDTSHAYNNGHMAYEATRDPYYALMLQANAVSILASIGLGNETSEAILVDPTITSTANYDPVSGYVTGALPFYLSTVIQYRARAWGVKEYNKCRVAASTQPAVDFLHPASVWNTVLSDVSNQFMKWSDAIQAVSITTTNANDAFKAGVKVMSWGDTPSYTNGFGIPGNLYSKQVASFFFNYIAGSYIYTVMSGLTSFNTLLSREIKGMCNRILYMGGRRSIPNVGAGGFATYVIPLNSSGVPTPLPIPFTTPTEYDTYWASVDSVYASYTKTSFTDADAVARATNVNVLRAVKSLNDAGSLSIVVSDVNAAITAMNSQVAGTSLAAGTGGVFTSNVFDY